MDAAEAVRSAAGAAAGWGGPGVARGGEGGSRVVAGSASSETPSSPCPVATEGGSAPRRLGRDHCRAAPPWRCPSTQATTPSPPGNAGSPRRRERRAAGGQGLSEGAAMITKRCGTRPLAVSSPKRGGFVRRRWGSPAPARHPAQAPVEVRRDAEPCNGRRRRREEGLPLLGLFQPLERSQRLPAISASAPARGDAGARGRRRRHGAPASGGTAAAVAVRPTQSILPGRRGGTRGGASTGYSTPPGQFSSDHRGMIREDLPLRSSQSIRRPSSARAPARCRGGSMRRPSFSGRRAGGSPTRSKSPLLVMLAEEVEGGPRGEVGESLVLSGWKWIRPRQRSG